MVVNGSYFQSRTGQIQGEMIVCAARAEGSDERHTFITGSSSTI